MSYKFLLKLRMNLKAKNKNQIIKQIKIHHILNFANFTGKFNKLITHLL